MALIFGFSIILIGSEKNSRLVTAINDLNEVFMKITTLMDIYNCLKGRGGEEIQLPENVIEGAGRCIRRMVELGE